MSLQGKITISRVGLAENDQIEITIKDKDACVEFVTASLSLEDFAQAITGISFTDCTFEVRGLDIVGKKMEMKRMEFQLDDEIEWKDRKAVAFDTAKAICEEGWTPDSYFGGQDSFFKKDNKQWARCIIRRWV